MRKEERSNRFSYLLNVDREGASLISDGKEFHKMTCREKKLLERVSVRPMEETSLASPFGRLTGGYGIVKPSASLAVYPLSADMESSPGVDTTKRFVDMLPSVITASDNSCLEQLCWGMTVSENSRLSASPVV